MVLFTDGTLPNNEKGVADSLLIPSVSRCDEHDPVSSGLDAKGKAHFQFRTDVDLRTSKGANNFPQSVLRLFDSSNASFCFFSCKTRVSILIFGVACLPESHVAVSLYRAESELMEQPFHWIQETLYFPHFVKP